MWPFKKKLRHKHDYRVVRCIHEDVAERLIANLQALPIRHDQEHWLTDHGPVFVISKDDRWGCATTGCAAGFIWLQEAPDGSVYVDSEGYVFNSTEEYERYNNFYSSEDPEEDPDSFYRWKADIPHISDWSAEVLGIDDDEQGFLFSNTDPYATTADTINRIRFLMTDYSDLLDYDGRETY